MNKIYDKLLLAVAILALLAGVGFYVMKSGELPSATPQVGQPGDGLYEPIPVPISTEVPGVWPDAVQTSAQAKESPLELYDVFTPPKIWIDKNGNFIFESPILPPTKDIPFGLYLAAIEREPYRIQLEGYIEDDLKDASKSLLLLYDEELQRQVRARVGKEKPKSEFKLIDFTIERVKDKDGNTSKIASATLLDQRTGEEVTLVHGERLYNDVVTVILRSNEDASIEVVLQEAPKAFETKLGKYSLEQINLEDSSVTVKKQGDEKLELEEEIKELQLSAPSEETKSPEEVEEKEDANSDVFDFAF
ncbi:MULTISPECIES: hypothetical protein [unclassified Lentimonas]|uniref:hypothetical protein n=1 Tax=unclassified Lentimonas TaxID=2630993 RepID=UPI001325BEE3|nr:MULTISPECIES: hypothetical protein [unclassified Lentimonas]CAA6679988.1 Unannotated [Lentimonas sp. CC4]CAA6686544.1 Unannotated [Lentimonas sp. CC6]CAA7074820.1 Unannotated [Lentimonas sp. CC4]CAA7169447.1 Unannotated [Lentimonas sp. CC21]CAA7180162.1 Unannotated [Lentimonas sp. CC8]